MSVGLDDVVAAETALSHVDGEAGRLIIRGFDLEELAGHQSFEAVAFAGDSRTVAAVAPTQVRLWGVW